MWSLTSTPHVIESYRMQRETGRDGENEKENAERREVKVGRCEGMKLEI